MKNRKLVIVGAGEFGEIAYEYFTLDSEYEVVAFAVEREYRNKDKLFGLPVLDFEDIEAVYPPKEYETFVAVTYVQLNRARKKLFEQCKKKGYYCASYISSHAFVWHNVSIGENVFVFENSTLQHYVSIKNNAILWSGSYIGHRSVIEEHCWIAPQCVIAGFCHIGKSCFIGVNATVGDKVRIEEDVVVGAGAVTVRNLEEPGSVYIGSPAKRMTQTSYEKFGIVTKQ